MGSKTSCDYCDKIIDKETNHIDVCIEGIIDSEGTLILGLDLCSEECLKKTLNLGSKLLEYGCTPEKCYAKLLEEE